MLVEPVPSTPVNDDEIERLYALIRVPSVSADPAHADDMDQAAGMLAEEINRAGGRPEVRATSGHPLVVGEVPASSADPDAPRVMIYGHYDVQPPGDLDRWDSPPFEPTVRDGALYARGASDDKGNLFMLLVAVQRLAAAGRLPVRVSILIDGEEESGGTSAVEAIADESAPTSACIIFDISMAEAGRAALCTGVRGLLYRRIQVTTADLDGHSGLFGGAALNANHALLAILSALVPNDGALAADLSAGAAPVDDDERATWGELPSGRAMLSNGGLAPADGQAAEEFYERTLAQASLDVHAMAAGAVDKVATVIPGHASAALSVRLAPGQDPESISAALERLVHEATPEGARVDIERLGDAPPAYMDPTAPPMRAAEAGLEAATGRPPALVRVGGTIPVVGAMVDAGIPVILTGFALPSDAIHSPNEHLQMAHLELGVRAAEEILTRLGVVD
jgi:acetylornithine deacetylase/succinyl-diaminopimelate desuccinylase-like protein